MAAKDRVASARTAMRRVRDVPDRAPTGTDAQPVSATEWIHRDRIRPNSWNPNYVPGPEIRLLKVSILSDGWTQPIVVFEAGNPAGNDEQIGFEIVDGEHRWIVSADPEVYGLTDGFVPCVVLREVSDVHRVMSTIRHNRARGQHHVLSMAEIVADLVNTGVPRDRIEELLSMEEEEIDRFIDVGNMPKRGSADGYSRGWVPG